MIDVDVVVVGGGPVGLVAAIEARLAGFTVVVIEPRVGPIDKACGEGLMPGAVPLLSRLGVDAQGYPLAGIGYYTPLRPSPLRVAVPEKSARSAGRSHPERAQSRGVEHRFAHGHGLGVRRTVLHASLTERALALEVELRTARVDALEQTEDSVTVSAGGPRIRCRWLLACDGLHSTVARLTDLASTAGGPRRYGVRQHFAVAPWSDLVEVHYGPVAELYVTPVGRNEVGVAMLAPKGTPFIAAVEAVPAIADRLAGADATSELRGAGPFQQRTRARVAGRVLLVGDASGYVDALTGEGLRLGFAQASAAVAAIAGDPARYEGEWRAITRDFRMLTGALAAWAGSPLRGGIVPTAARLPGLFGAVVERLAT